MTATSRWRISSCVPSSVTVDIQVMASAGAPLRAAAWAMSDAVRLIQRTAAGWGLITMAQRALIAIRIL